MFLSEELLQEIHERAPRYDKENAWPEEDYAALKEAGYLKSFVMLQKASCWRLGFLNHRTIACYSVLFLRLVRKRTARIVFTARKSSYLWGNIATS